MVNNHIVCFASDNPNPDTAPVDREWVFKVSSAGTIRNRSGIISRNLVLELDPDNPDNYVSNTNADGEAEQVYSGPQLDVKSLLLEFQSKIETLEAAKASLEARLSTLEGGSN